MQDKQSDDEQSIDSDNSDSIIDLRPTNKITQPTESGGCSYEVWHLMSDEVNRFVQKLEYSRETYKPFEDKKYSKYLCLPEGYKEFEAQKIRQSASQFISVGFFNYCGQSAKGSSRGKKKMDDQSLAPSPASRGLINSNVAVHHFRSRASNTSQDKERFTHLNKNLKPSPVESQKAIAEQMENLQIKSQLSQPKRVTKKKAVIGNFSLTLHQSQEISSSQEGSEQLAPQVETQDKIKQKFLLNQPPGLAVIDSVDSPVQPKVKEKQKQVKPIEEEKSEEEYGSSSSLNIFKFKKPMVGLNVKQDAATMGNLKPAVIKKEQ